MHIFRSNSGIDDVEHVHVEYSGGKKVAQSPYLQAGLASLFLILVLALFQKQSIIPQTASESTTDRHLQQAVSQLQIQTAEIVKHLLLLSNPEQAASSYQRLDELLNQWNVQHHQLIQTVTDSDPAATKIDEQITPLFEQITSDVLKVLSGQQSPEAMLPRVLTSEQKLMPLLVKFQSVLPDADQAQTGQAASVSHHWFFWLVLPVTAYAASFYLLTRVRKRKDSLDKRETDLDLRIQNLKSNQSQLAASISASFHETWSWTEQTNEFWCSKSFWRVFGYTAESEFPLAQYEVFLNHLGAGNRESWEAAIERHLQESKPIDLKVRTRNQLGFTRWVRIQAQVLNGEREGQRTLIGTVEDIHDYQLTKLQLNQSEKLLSRVGEVAKIGGWHLDLETRELFWTQETYAIHEVEPGYLPSINTAYSFYAPEARPVLQSALERAIETGQSWDLKLPFITAKGRHIWVRAQGELEYEQGNPVRLVGAFQDITEEKQREADFPPSPIRRVYIPSAPGWRHPGGYGSLHHCH